MDPQAKAAGILFAICLVALIVLAFHLILVMIKTEPVLFSSSHQGVEHDDEDPDDFDRDLPAPRVSGPPARAREQATVKEKPVETHTQPGLFLSLAGPKDFIRVIDFCRAMKRMLGVGAGQQLFNPQTGPVRLTFGPSIHVYRIDDPDLKRHKYFANYAIIPKDNLGKAIVADYRKAFKDITYEPEEA